MELSVCDVAVAAAACAPPQESTVGKAPAAPRLRDRRVAEATLGDRLSTKRVVVREGIKLGEAGGES